MLDELLHRVSNHTPTTLETDKRFPEAAVLVPVDEWRRLQAAARPSLKQLLLSEEARADLLVPARGSARRPMTAVL